MNFFQYDMLRDPKLINMFRELLVIFRIWGLIRHSCLPAFSYMENVDVIATLFRILTRLLQTSEPDESLLGKLLRARYIVVAEFYFKQLVARLIKFLIQI